MTIAELKIARDKATEECDVAEAEYGKATGRYSGRFFAMKVMGDPECNRLREAFEAAEERQLEAVYAWHDAVDDELERERRDASMGLHE